jgi:beta-N-acetylhexosaminidase
MDLSDRQIGLLEGLTALNKPYVAVMFGNPYTATFLSKLPTMLLAYEEFDEIELAAVRALSGDAPIRGKLPISLPGLFPIGHGLERAAAR